MNWYIAVLKKYVVFSGRASRSEYWYFVLFSAIVSIILTVIDVMMGSGTADTSVSADAGMAMSVNMGWLSGIYSLGVLLPSLGVLFRRLHDTDHSGWWILISLIPLIGAIVLLVFLVKDSTPGNNEYGPSPKGIQP
jgi:uncharacterized membrane protein YhaH (DUF805 family)